MPRACPVCASVYDSDAEYCSADGARLSTADAFIGRSLGRFVVKALLGTGSHGSVYVAHDTKRQTDVAIKVLRGVAPGKAAKRRFEREAEAIGTIRHPNVVSIVDFGVDGRVAYLAMELLRGPTLAEVIEREGALSPQRAIRIATQIAGAIAHAHRAGFVHRDLKPSNVLLVAEHGEEVVRIVDFGVAGYVDPDDDTRLTRDGGTVGTPAYMAPEQVFDSTVGPAADIYALGIVLYEMLTGTVPFTGSVNEVALQQVASAPAPLPPLGGLSELVMRMLEKKPEVRLASAEVVIDELEQIARGIEVTQVGFAPTLPPAQTLPLAPTAPLPRPKYRWMLWAFAALTAIAIGAHLGRTPPEAPVQIEPEPAFPRPQLTETSTPAEEEQAIIPEPPPPEPPPNKERAPMIKLKRRPKSKPAQPPTPPAPEKIDFAHLSATLDRLERSLENTELDENARNALYLEYLELRTAARPGLEPDQYQALETKARALAARLR